MKFDSYIMKDLISEISMGPFGSNIKVECFVDSGIPVLNGSNLTGYALNEASFRYVTEEKADSLRKANAYRGDIVITHRGTLGQIVFIPRDSKYDRYVISQSQFRVKCNEKILPEYLVYYFHTNVGQYKLLSNASQVGVPALARASTTFQMLEIDVPEISEQRKIVALLECIREKIELNNKINDNLGQQIRIICTAWLSDFKPFGGSMPADWSIYHLSDIADFISGYSYKGNELLHSSIAMATIKNFDRKGGFKLDGYKELKPSAKLKDNQYAEMFDTLVAHTDLTQNAEVIGNAEPILSKSGYDDIIFSMDLVKVISKTKHISKFLIAGILQDRKFKEHCLGYVNGTTVLHLSKKALPEYKLALPNNLSVLKPLDEIVTTLYKQISNNIEEINQLVALRDSLLPKLMSGEIDVSNIEI